MYIIPRHTFFNISHSAQIIVYFVDKGQGLIVEPCCRLTHCDFDIFSLIYFSIVHVRQGILAILHNFLYIQKKCDLENANIFFYIFSILYLNFEN